MATDRLPPQRKRRKGPPPVVDATEELQVVIMNMRAAKKQAKATGRPVLCLERAHLRSGTSSVRRATLVNPDGSTRPMMMRMSGRELFVRPDKPTVAPPTLEEIDAMAAQLAAGKKCGCAECRAVLQDPRAQWYQWAAEQVQRARAACGGDVKVWYRDGEMCIAPARGKQR